MTRLVNVKTLAILLAGLAVVAASGASAQTVSSPDGRISAIIEPRDSMAILLRVDGKECLRISGIALDLSGGGAHGLSRVFRRFTTTTVLDTIFPVVREKRSMIPEHYRELRLEFENWRLTVRVFNDAAAYRFETMLPESVTVSAERAAFVLSRGDSLWASVVLPRDSVDGFHTSYENPYVHCVPESLSVRQPTVLPAVIESHTGVRMGITESDLLDYPGMYLEGTGTDAVRATFPAYPAETRVFGGGFKQQLVTRREPFIAKTIGTRTFPWRVVAIARRDAELIENDVVYRLASPLQLNDVRWIRPGHAFDEWIFNHSLYGVNFQAGYNTATYEYYADFAARFGIDYIMFDAGWSDVDDLQKTTPEMDIPGIIRYAASKGVGVILWTQALTLDRTLDASLDQFVRWGAKGVLTDFMDRDDQVMVNFYERAARAAAKRKLFISFHGAFKPTGLQRAFPNNITREAVMGHEYNKWSDKVTPPYTAAIPYVRMLAGPLDFEGGSMINLQQSDFHPMFNVPASQGTRIHELASYVVFESPLQYLAGNPSDYEREPDYTKFLTSIPPVWDETLGLDGKIGHYVVVARRSGSDWYVGVMNDWVPRSLTLPTNFLPEGTCNVMVYEDGPNAGRNGRDYQVREVKIKTGEPLKVQLAPGGGYVARLRLR